jgi:hypothetical protein
MIPSLAITEFRSASLLPVAWLRCTKVSKLFVFSCSRSTAFCYVGCQWHVPVLYHPDGTVCCDASHRITFTPDWSRSKSEAEMFYIHILPFDLFHGLCRTKCTSASSRIIGNQTASSMRCLLPYVFSCWMKVRIALRTASVAKLI